MSSNIKQKYRLIMIFFVSLVTSLALLFVGNQVIKQRIHQRMVDGSIRSARETDGAVNHIILDGKSGYIGNSHVYLRYLDDGFISLIGKNETGHAQWKQLCEIKLGQGTYTFTGSIENDDNSVGLRLAKVDEEGVTTLAWLYHDNIMFTLDEDSIVRIHVMILSDIEVEAIARPAIFEERDDE